MRVAIDIDGVLRDFAGANHHVFVNEGLWPADKPAPEITEWDIWKCYGIDKDTYVDLIFNRRSWHAFMDAHPFQGAWEFLDAVSRIARVDLLTTQTPKSWVLSVDWVSRQPGWLQKIHGIVCCRPGESKADFDYDILVDDKPENIEEFSVRGIGVLLDRPWNRRSKLLGAVGPVHRVFSFCDCVDMISMYQSHPYGRAK